VDDPAAWDFGARDGAPNPGARDEGFAALGQETWSQPIEQQFPYGERPTVNNLARAGDDSGIQAGAMPSRQPQPSQPTIFPLITLVAVATAPLTGACRCRHPTVGSVMVVNRPPMPRGTSSCVSADQPNLWARS
jgi:hypothetical protein